MTQIKEISKYVDSITSTKNWNLWYKEDSLVGGCKYGIVSRHSSVSQVELSLSDRKPIGSLFLTNTIIAPNNLFIPNLYKGAYN